MVNEFIGNGNVDRAIELRNEMLCEMGNVFKAITKRRNVDMEVDQAVVEVFSKSIFSDELVLVLVPPTGRISKSSSTRRRDA
jgi:hypothetical protein